MRYSFGVLSLALIATFVVTACDRGRVIDEAERRRIISGETADTSPTYGLSVSRDSSGIVSRQGSYFFSLLDLRNDSFVYYSIALESLLRLDAPVLPLLKMAGFSFDMSCAEMSGPDCIRWTRSLNLSADISTELPSLDFTVTLTRGDRYQLEGDLGGGNQVIANFESFEIQFVLGEDLGTLRTYRVAKQNYVDATPLAILSQSWISSDGFDDLDKLLFSYVLFPVPSYGLQPQTATRLVLTPTRWQIDWPFLNVTSGATQTVIYIVEKL